MLKSLGSYGEKVIGQILAVVDPSVHWDESLQGGFVLHVGVVEARVQHDDGKRQDVARVWVWRGVESTC